MSEIYGIYKRNGVPVDPEMLKNMGSSMEYWRPAGIFSKENF
jgi:hypothetical protein